MALGALAGGPVAVCSSGNRFSRAPVSRGVVSGRLKCGSQLPSLSVKHGFRFLSTKKSDPSSLAASPGCCRFRVVCCSSESKTSEEKIEVTHCCADWGFWFLKLEGSIGSTLINPSCEELLLSSAATGHEGFLYFRPLGKVYFFFNGRAGFAWHRNSPAKRLNSTIAKKWIRG